MADVEFDRDAVEVSAKTDWQDAADFARIGSFLASLQVAPSALELPVGDNAGIGALRRALIDFRSTLRWVVLEYEDACAVLGSGQEAAITDFDETEYQQVDDFRELVSRLEG